MMPPATAAVLPADAQGLWRTLATLAVPAVLAAWLKSSFLIIDTFYAGRLGTGTLAAVAAATLFGWVFQSLSQVNSLGAMSACAQAFGAGDRPLLQATFRRALMLALAMGAAASVVFTCGVGSVMSIQGLPEGVDGTAKQFLWALWLWGPSFWLFDTLERTLQGVGDTRTPLAVTIAMVGLNLLLDPALAFGFGPIPALGVVGIATATGLCWTLGAACLFWAARRQGLWGRTAVPAPAAGRLWRVGWPAALAGIAFDLIWLVLMPLISRDGPAAMAAVSIGHNLESIGFLATVGIGSACTALVGQAVGSGRWELVGQVTRLACLAAFVFNAAWAALLLAQQPFFFGLFTRDAAVTAFGADYVVWAIAVLGLQAIGFVLIDAFAGIGTTWVASAVLIATYGMRLPLAFGFAQRYGAAGVFMVIGATAAGAGLAMILAFVVWIRHRRRQPATPPSSLVPVGTPAADLD